MTITVHDRTISAEHISPIDLLGTRVENTFTAEEAMREGHLGGWNVRKWPAVALDPNTGEMIEKTGMSDVVRDNPATGKVEVLSRYSVSDGFTIVQNEEHAEFLNTLVDESGANFEMAGSLDGGRKVFLSMKLPGHINIAGVDPVENSLLAINSHDGSMSFTLAILPVRYACSNILNTNWGGLSNIIRIRHTSGMHTNLVSRAREALDISFKYLDTFQEQADRLINITMTQSKFEEIMEKEFGAPDDASNSVVARADRKIEQMCELFAEANTQDGIRDTAWAGFNALAEWNDHFSPTRGATPDLARAAKSVLDADFKNRAMRMMLAAG